MRLPCIVCWSDADLVFYLVLVWLLLKLLVSIQPAASAVGIIIVFPALTFTGRDFEGLALVFYRPS